MSKKIAQIAQLNDSLRTFLKNEFISSRRLVLVRSAESQGSLAGTISGWTNVKLTDYGRRQAFQMNQVFEEHKDSFDEIHGSDLQRCIDTAFYTMGFPSQEDFLRQSRNLREMNFGDNEGLHFDSLSREEKQEYSDLNYRAPNGESWIEVKQRMEQHFASLPVGNHLIFTHGGPITTLLLSYGVTTMPNNCSWFGVTLDDTDLSDGSVKSLEFEWHFPKE